MSRPLRIEFAGALYHLTSRGGRREAIYEDDEDRQRFLDVLAEVVERYNWIFHAYCLMTNHYHLVAETVAGNLSQGMRHFNGESPPKSPPEGGGPERRLVKLRGAAKLPPEHLRACSECHSGQSP